MRGLFWQKLPPQPPGGFWAGCAATLTPDETAALQKLFGVRDVRPAPRVISAGESTPSPARAGKHGAGLLSLSRSNNVGILLSQWKGRGAADKVLDALSRGVVARLPLHTLGMLLQLVPTDEERKAFERYTGPDELLAPAERFVRSLAEVPRLGPKLAALVFVQEAGDLHAAAVAALASTRAACEQVRGSASLKAALSAVLAVGNALNADTPRGGAPGFHVEVLLKLKTLKAGRLKAAEAESDRASAGGALAGAGNLLEVVVAVARRLGAGPLQAELPEVPAAARRSLGDLEETVAAFSGGLASLKREVDAAARSQAEADFVENVSDRAAALEGDAAGLDADAARTLEGLRALAAELGAPPLAERPEELFGTVAEFARDFDALLAPGGA